MLWYGRCTVTRAMLCLFALTVSRESPLAAWENQLYRADTLAERGNVDSAIGLVSGVLDSLILLRGPSDTSVASAWIRLSAFYGQRHEGPEAERAALLAFEIDSAAVGPDHPATLQALYALANAHHSAGRSPDFLNGHEIALARRRNVLPADHPDLLASLIGVVRALGAVGRYREALRLGDSTAETFESALSGDERLRAAWARAQAFSLLKLERHDAADSLIRLALELHLKLFGPDSPEVANSLTNLGILSWNLGDLPAAESLLQRALAIRRRVFGPRHFWVASSLFNLGGVLTGQGRCREALVSYETAQAVGEAATEPGHPSVAYGLVGLAGAYQRVGEWLKAENALQRALVIQEAALDSMDVHLAFTLERLAGVHAHAENYARARTLLERALTILNFTYGPDAPRTAYAVNSMAYIELAQGRPTEAENRWRRVAATLDVLPLPPAGLQASATEGLCQVQRLYGAHREALTLALRAARIRETQFRRIARYTSELEALQAMGDLRYARDLLLTCYFELPSRGDWTETVVDLCLATKGSVMDEIFDRQKFLAREQDPEILSRADALRSLRFQIAAVYVGGSGSDFYAYRIRLDSLTARAANLEGELSRSSASFREQRESVAVTAAAVRACLRPGELCMDFIRYGRVSDTVGRQRDEYAVVLLNPSGSPELMTLGSADSLDRLVSAFRGHFEESAARRSLPTRADVQQYQKTSQPLAQKLLAPILPRLPEVRRLLIAPDGELNAVSFAALPFAEDRYLAEKVLLHYLTAARDLLRQSPPGGGAEGLLAMGDPDFDAPPAARRAALFDSADRGRTNGRESAWAVRNVRTDCGLEALDAEPLPATGREVEQIAVSWRQAVGEPADVFTGDRASEDELKRRAPGHRVLHLATHGYFIRDDCRSNFGSQPHTSAPVTAGDDPLLRTGLLLTGANLKGEGAGEAGVEDGILTAREVSALDLSNTEWVVLSACESGLGRIENGEGVYGLRRAFLEAGARTVVSSLWAIPDLSTADMLAGIYEKSESSISERVRRVQLALLNRLRRAGLADHPYSWASFVVIGDL